MWKSNSELGYAETFVNLNAIEQTQEWGVRNLISTQEPTDDEIEAELNTMLGAPAAAAALADVKQEA